MDQTLRPVVLPTPTHLQGADRLRVDLLALRDRACDQKCPATVQALDLALEMLEVERDPDDGSIRRDPF